MNVKGVPMKQLIKPKALKAGDTIAAITLSYGAAGQFPKRYAQGARQIEESFGVKVIPTPHALDAPEAVYNHPEARLSDLMGAFENPAVQGIICNIGGDDTIRLLRLMDERHFEIIRANPKVFLGISDSTVNHFMCYWAGLGSFYSACLMFGYAENGGIPEIMVENTKKTLFSTEPAGVLPESKEFIVDAIDWALENPPVRPRLPSTPWRYIQGEKPARGPLIGGCTDVLVPFLSGTPLWPRPEEFEGAILFLENSEEQPPPAWVKYWLRNLGAQGILEKINGILFARPGSGFFKDAAERDAWLKQYPDFDAVILQVLKEYGRADMPVVTNMDFGHTVPQLILPYGVTAEINPAAKTVALVESAVA